MSFLARFLFAFALPPAAAGGMLALVCRSVPAERFLRSWFYCAAGALASVSLCLLPLLGASDWRPRLLGAAASVAAALAARWWRRKGRRAMKAIGGRARAVFAVIARTLRETAQPRPVPQHARARKATA